jgi:hypothetical protein
MSKYIRSCELSIKFIELDSGSGISSASIGLKLGVLFEFNSGFVRKFFKIEDETLKFKIAYCISAQHSHLRAFCAENQKVGLRWVV